MPKNDEPIVPLRLIPVRPNDIKRREEDPRGRPRQPMSSRARKK